MTMQSNEHDNPDFENRDLSAEEQAAKDAAREEVLQGEDSPVSDDEGVSFEGHDKDAEIEALKLECAKMKDQALRAIAESENVRRRAVKEREDAGKFAISSFAKDLLDFSDNFGRALNAIPEELQNAEGPIKAVLDGISTMEKELIRTFDKHGIERIEPQDQMFDPNFHEVMFESVMPGAPAGQIIQVIEPGYILKGRLLRPARVGIAKDDGQGGAASGHAVDTEA